MRSLCENPRNIVSVRTKSPQAAFEDRPETTRPNSISTQRNRYRGCMRQQRCRKLSIWRWRCRAHCDKTRLCPWKINVRNDIAKASDLEEICSFAVVFLVHHCQRSKFCFWKISANFCDYIKSIYIFLRKVRYETEMFTNERKQVGFMYKQLQLKIVPFVKRFKVIVW